MPASLCCTLSPNLAWLHLSQASYACIPHRIRYTPVCPMPMALSVPKHEAWDNQAAIPVRAEHHGRSVHHVSPSVARAMSQPRPLPPCADVQPAPASAFSWSACPHRVSWQSGMLQGANRPSHWPLHVATQCFGTCLVRSNPLLCRSWLLA